MKYHRLVNQRYGSLAVRYHNEKLTQNQIKMEQKRNVKSSVEMQHQSITSLDIKVASRISIIFQLSCDFCNAISVHLKQHYILYLTFDKTYVKCHRCRWWTTILYQLKLQHGVNINFIFHLFGFIQTEINISMKRADLNEKYRIWCHAIKKPNIKCY